LFSILYFAITGLNVTNGEDKSGGREALVSSAVTEGLPRNVRSGELTEFIAFCGAVIN
jgi:hypothetical protein